MDFNAGSDLLDLATTSILDLESKTFTRELVEYRVAMIRYLRSNYFFYSETIIRVELGSDSYPLCLKPYLAQAWLSLKENHSRTSSLCRNWLFSMSPTIPAASHPRLAVGGVGASLPGGIHWVVHIFSESPNVSYAPAWLLEGPSAL